MKLFTKFLWFCIWTWIYKLYGINIEILFDFFCCSAVVSLWFNFQIQITSVLWLNREWTNHTNTRKKITYLMTSEFWYFWQWLHRILYSNYLSKEIISFWCSLNWIQYFVLFFLFFSWFHSHRLSKMLLFMWKEKNRTL